MGRLDPTRLRVYVVTTAAFAGRGHDDVAAAAIVGGATAIQLRAPELGDAELRRLAADLAGWCRNAGVLFIVNDRPDVAADVDAGGAHVGQADDLRSARAELGPDRILGISVGGPDEAWAAGAAGADYLGVTVWATATKPDADPIGLDGLAMVVGSTDLPVVGIGGIDASSAARVLERGAAGVAVVSAVAAAADVVAATKELARAVQDTGEGGR